MVLNSDKPGGQLSGEEIVISGISGYFPQTENAQKLIDNLYNKVDMIQKYGYNDLKHPELPQYCGKIDNMDRFDTNFFRFTRPQAASFDPICRKTIEQAYSAMFDAGINPETLKGTKLGVFIGSSQSDVATMSLYDIFLSNGFVISGCSKTMLANRISYWIDGKGPSYGLDLSCAGSMACLEIAVERIKAGDCDSAIVGGCNLVQHPGLTVNMSRAGLLCLDGKTKCFDKNGDGYVRSDAISLMFLQKAKDAKRIYTQVYHVEGKYFSDLNTTCVPSRNSKDIEKFLEHFYSDIDVSPEAVEYVEANAIGIAEADEKELVAIGNIFGKMKPIKVGSIKSNLGHTESASGACSLTKICLSYQRGEIPANLHYNEPQNQIPAIREGQVQVLTDNTKFDRSFTALNNFSITGANYHVLLKGHFKPKDTNKYESEIPYLVFASGRLDQSVNKILSTLENNPIDPEQIALLNNIFKYNIPGHTGRGYTIIDTNNKNKTTCLSRGFEFYNGTTRPVWFLYSGMGSQWPAMGADLMRVPIFAATIERCNAVLQKKGVNIIKIITNDDKELFNNILNCFLGLTAIQIALTEVLRSVGIAPDNIIGHSAGEISCAYADGSLTLEEAMLVSYFRGIVSLETKMIKGKMAAIGLDHKEVRKLCPSEIDIACQNSSESTTISGPAEEVEKFVAYLTERSIFARTVASADIAYHSRYVADAGPSLLTELKSVIKNPKARSKLWLSTAFAPHQWSEETSLYSSAEYFAHNLLNTVYFDETAKMIPNDAIVIEIAPHGLMQAIMKRSHKSCMNVSLARRGETNTVKLLLQAVGTLYQAGLNPDVDALYPKIDFPVSTETSGLSHLVDWDHSDQWLNGKFHVKKKTKTFSYEFTMSTHDDEHSFIEGCIRNGVNIFPEAALLVIVWKTLAMHNGMYYGNVPVEFTNVKFHTVAVVYPEEVLKLLVEIQRETNLFEVTQNNKIIASGFIKSKLSVEENFAHIQFDESDNHLNVRDVYNLMSTKGYNYEGLFKSIEHLNIERNKGILKWNSNWVTFLDSIFQLNAISRNHDGMSNLKLITRLSIDVEEHKVGKTTNFDSVDGIGYSAQVLGDNAVTKCGGVVLRSITFEEIPRAEQIATNLQIKKFFPHNPNFGVNLQTALQVNLQIISERVKGKVLVQYNKSDYFSNISSVFKAIVEAIPSLNVEIISVSIFDSTTLEAKHDVLLMYDFDKNQIEQSICCAEGTKFFIAIMSQIKQSNLPKNYSVVTKFNIGNLTMVLLEKTNSRVLSESSGGYYYIPVQVKSKLDNMQLINGISNDCKISAWAEIPSVPNNNTIQIMYSGVYINDYEKPADIGKNVNKNGVGFSGVNSRGERVMGVVQDGSVSSLVEADYDLLWPVPQHWTLEEAATVPLPYIQAYYCLRIRGNLRRGDSVYINKGDSALSQAVIALCLSLDCKVFTTVSSIAKKKMLMNNFKNLDESHIGFTHNSSFYYTVLRANKNRRCDIVINCEKGSLRQEATKFVGQLRNILDVSDHDMEENNTYETAFNVQERSYISVRLSNIFLPEYSNDKKKLQLLLSEGITNGNVRPLNRVVYTPDEISRAFQLLSTDYSSTILINMKNPELCNDCKIMHRIELSSSKSYIVMCDGTELGVELIDHLIRRGAKRFLIHMKPKTMNGYFHVKYASWKKNDVIIQFNSDDLHIKSGCDALIAEGEHLGGVDGIFITQNELTTDRSGKINSNNDDISLITSNLDAASRNCTLKYFAVLYYTSQDHKLAFSEIEKCCFMRCQIGLPSLVLRYESNEKKNLQEALSKLYNALETSLKQNYTSVFLSDTKPKSTLCFDEKIYIDDGLKAFFNNICQDECSATEPVISMKTQLSNENECEIYMNLEDTHVMMIPGFDGNCQTMRNVAERLKIPAVTLQLEPDFVTSIPDIAKRLLNIARKRFNMKSKFYILGYSFGVNVALELAAMLEKEGRTGVVFCLDSSPDALKNQLIAYTGNMTDQQLQNTLIEHFYDLLSDKPFDKLKEHGAPTLEWSEKVDIFVDNIKGSVSYTHEFLKTLINAFYRRIVMARSYEPNFKLNSKLVLMKGIPHPRSEILSDDYGLSKFTNKPVEVFNLEADHANAPHDIRVSNIINKMLDPGLLEEFEKKDLCQYFFS